MKRLYLVSTSPRRRLLLSRLGYTFTVIPPRWQEPPVAKQILPDYTLSVAWRKLESVLPEVGNRQAVFLAADTVVWKEGEVLGKPRDLEEARRFLKRLSGQTHWVFTALVLYDRLEDRRWQILVKTKVRFKHLTEDEIRWILEQDNPLDKAGGYAFQGTAGLFVESIEGNVFNVIGLPIPHVMELLRKAGLEPDLDRGMLNPTQEEGDV